MGLLGTLLMWGGIGRFGRRRIYLVGQAGMAIVLGVMGILGFFKTTAIVYTTSAMLIFMNFIFQCTVGPACYTYVAELPAAEVRSPTIVVARGAYILSGLVTGQLTPRMLSTEEWDWGAKCGLFWYVIVFRVALTLPGWARTSSASSTATSACQRQGAGLLGSWTFSSVRH
jgi:SP family general alpha glucoside:H+ symporter-like MFS transporter